MKIIKVFAPYSKYSLHDGRIQKMTFEQGNLVLHFDKIFSYDDDGEHTHKAKVIFEQVDVDDLNVLVFDSTLRDVFHGEQIDFDTYQQRYKNSEFEVIDEMTNWGQAMFQGWLRTNGVPVHCIMTLYFGGRMIYDIEDESE